MPRERLLPYLAFGVVCFVWGTTYLAIRVAIETIPTFLLAGTRFTLAGLILLLCCLLRGERLPRRLADWWNLTQIGFLMVCIANVVVVWAEHFIESGLTALLVATAPFWMALIETARRNGERVTRRKALGMTIGFSGVAVLVAPDLRPESFNAQLLWGVIILQIGSICWNIGSVRSKYHPVQASPLLSASIQMLTGGVIVTTIGLIAGEAPRFHFNGPTLAAWLYLTIFGSVVAYGAYVYALSKLRTSTLSLYAYINPAVAVILGWLILDESIGWRSILAMLIIFSGVALVQTGGKRRATVEQPLPAIERLAVDG